MLCSAPQIHFLSSKHYFWLSIKYWVLHKPIFPSPHNLVYCLPHKLFSITFLFWYNRPWSWCCLWSQKDSPSNLSWVSVSICCDPSYIASLPTINQDHTSCYAARNCLAQDSLVITDCFLTALIKLNRTIHQVCVQKTIREERHTSSALLSCNSQAWQVILK